MRQSRRPLWRVAQTQMHEASIVQDLVEAASRRTPAGTRVLRVFVRVGRLTCVSPEALELYFEVLREETLGGQAELVVTLAPLRGRCAACRTPFEVAERIWSCRACAAPALAFDNGDELDLDALEVEDVEPDHDRAEDTQEERRSRR